MAQVAFSFATSDIIKVTSGASMGSITGNFIIQGFRFQGSAKGIGARVTCLNSGRTIFNQVTALTNGSLDMFFPQRPYRACGGMNVVMSSGEMEIYLM
jgi:hypothetical protein